MTGDTNAEAAERVRERSCNIHAGWRVVNVNAKDSDSAEVWRCPACLYIELETLKREAKNQSHMICAYCSNRTERAGLTDEEFADAVNLHIYSCEKRPETKLVNVLYSISVAMGIDIETLPEKTTPDLFIEAFDKAWTTVADARNVVIDQLAALVKNAGQPGECRGCKAPIFWIRHANGKNTPYTPAGLNHFIDCPDSARFKK